MASATRVFALAGVVAALLPGISISEDAKSGGYVRESWPGNSAVTGSFGQCWHTSFWNEQERNQQCNPGAAAAAEPRAAPAPPPAPEPPKAAEQPAPPVTQPLQAEDTTPTPLPPPVQQSPRLETALLPQTVHYSTDAFFDFDESTLRPEGRAALDELVTELGEVKYGSIRVIGHTDRIGGDQYNLALSERRANAVKNYLARKSVPTERIEAVGKGKADPTGETRDCTGPKSPKVIKCLQPDRRVDIEVAGTKDSTTGAR